MNVVFAFRLLSHVYNHESTIRELCARGHRVEVVIDPDLKGKPTSWAAIPAGWVGVPPGLVCPEGGLTVDPAIARRGPWRVALSAIRAALAYASYRRRVEGSARFFERVIGDLPGPLRWLMQLPLIGSLLVSDRGTAALRALERRIPPARSIARWVDEAKPDVVVGSPANMPPWGDVEYLKAAKAAGIPTVAAVLSWDNLTTKGIFPVEPDALLVWNEAQVREAEALHSVARERIVITGAPFFDKWLDTAHEMGDPETFLRAAGLPPGQPFVTYLGSSPIIAENEVWLIREVAEALRTHPEPAVRSLSLLIRPHPSNLAHVQKMNEERGVVWPREGTFPASEEARAIFASTLAHTVATIGINTSAMIDAVVNDRPCIALLAERYLVTQQATVHFQHLLKAEVLQTARTGQECADVIAGLLRGDDEKREARARFVRKFIRPRGAERPAGAAAADAIELAASRRSASEIDRTIGQRDLSQEPRSRRGGR